SAGTDLEHVAVELVRDLGASGGSDGPPFELLTVYAGADGGGDEARSIAETLSEAFPDLEIEVQEGGQPRYHYLFGIE
ncbi:MAG TPA: hypothetical protein VEA19_04210, partial [Actinomycetota bacterium]|nr:hypothetical protein [Actinomycetota bacterium]